MHASASPLPFLLRPSVPIHPLQGRVAALEKQLREAEKQLKDAERKLKSAEEREERHRRASAVCILPGTVGAWLTRV